MAQNSMLSADWAVRTVPADVWRYTFVICYRSPFRATSGVVRLGHVCRTWRSIVHGAPELWTNVNIKVVHDSEGPHITPKPELLPIILRNSGAMPLKMSLRTFWDPDQKLDDFVDVARRFFQATKRAKCLDLDFSSINVLTLHGAAKEIRTCNILQDLRLGFRGDGVEIILLISGLWSSAPFLRSFRLTGSFVNPINLDLIAALETSNFPFHQLTILAVESRISVKSLLRILPSTPSLISATLTHIVGEMDEGPSKDLTLQALESLTMEGLGEESPPLTPLLRYFISPSLTTLSLGCDRGWSLDSFKTFVVKSSPRIEHLDLGIMDSSDDDKIDCLRLLPSLRTLTLILDKYIIEQDESMFLGEQFCLDMQQWDTSADAFAVCPNLEKLTINYQALRNKTGTIFANMIETRWRKSPAGRDFEVHISDVYHTPKDKKSSELIRLLVMKQSGLNLTVFEPQDWLDGLLGSQ